jgi:hypothetical protein
MTTTFCNHPTKTPSACNVLTAKEQTPNKEDTTPAAKPPENEDSPPWPEPNRRRLCKQEHEQIWPHNKKIFATLAKNTQIQLIEQED